MLNVQNVLGLGCLCLFLFLSCSAQTESLKEEVFVDYFHHINFNEKTKFKPNIFNYLIRKGGWEDKFTLDHAVNLIYKHMSFGMKSNVEVYVKWF